MNDLIGYLGLLKDYFTCTHRPIFVHDVLPQNLFILIIPLRKKCFYNFGSKDWLVYRYIDRYTYVKPGWQEVLQVRGTLFSQRYKSDFWSSPRNILNIFNTGNPYYLQSNSQIRNFCFYKEVTYILLIIANLSIGGPKR